MKRALAILAVASMFGFAGFAQFSGEWDTNIHVLSPSSLDYTKLTINYEWSGWTFTSLSEFTDEGYSDQSFSGKGVLGPAEIEASMAFAPGDETIYECGGSKIWTVKGPHYKSSSLEASLEFGGVSFSLAATHDANYVAIFTEDEIQTNGSNNLSEWTSDCYDKYLLVAEEGYYCQTDSKIALRLPSYMACTLTVEADPISAEIVFDDVCTGIQFKEATISLSDLSLCCGITSDAELAFNKCKGFDYLKFTAKDLFPICCGISFDLSVKFTNDTKEVSITPKMEEIGDACFTLYTDLDWSNNAIGGLKVYGWKIRCDLAECNYIEILSALNVTNVTEVEKILDEDVFKGDEFEYAKLGFCGPGCCGGNYKVDVAIYFDNGGGLFGVSRLGANTSIPVMSNFTVNSSFAVKTGGGTTLDVGWTFTF